MLHTSQHAGETSIPEPTEEPDTGFEQPEPVLATDVEDGDAARLRTAIVTHLCHSQPLRRAFHLH